MKQKTKRQTAYWLKVAVIGIALGFALQFVRAWTEPAVAPPGGNVGAPINTGANVQEKGDAANSADFCVWNAGVRKCMSSISTSTAPPPPTSTSNCKIGLNIFPFLENATYSCMYLDGPAIGEYPSGFFLSIPGPSPALSCGGPGGCFPVYYTCNNGTWIWEYNTPCPQEL